MSWLDNVQVSKRVEREAEEAIRTAIQNRKDKIEAAKETSGLKEVEIETAVAWIENKIDEAGTVAEIKVALKDILSKMVSHILT